MFLHCEDCQAKIILTEILPNLSVLIYSLRNACCFHSLYTFSWFILQSIFQLITDPSVHPSIHRYIHPFIRPSMGASIQPAICRCIHPSLAIHPYREFISSLLRDVMLTLDCKQHHRATADVSSDVNSCSTFKYRTW